MCNLMLLKQCCEAMIYNNDCLHVLINLETGNWQIGNWQSRHRNMALGRIPQHLLRICFNTIGYCFKEWQGMMVTTRENTLIKTVLKLLFFAVLDWLFFIGKLCLIYFNFVKWKTQYKKKTPKFSHCYILLT